jgi:hypothetical protein
MGLSDRDAGAYTLENGMTLSAGDRRLDGVVPH